MYIQIYIYIYYIHCNLNCETKMYTFMIHLRGLFSSHMYRNQKFKATCKYVFNKIKNPQAKK